jgi:protein-tyrosine-phosphatase
MSRPYNVLFICTGNSARSILAEALASDPAVGRGSLRGFSAGSHPKDRPNPYALELLEQEGMAVDHLRSKSWDEFAGPGAPRMDFVFTVCDQAAGEQCPFWPGHPVTAHWGLPDPAAVEGTDEEKRRAFRDAFLVLKGRISLLANLLDQSLDPATLQQRLREIGRE